MPSFPKSLGRHRSPGEMHSTLIQRILSPMASSSDNRTLVVRTVRSAKSSSFSVRRIFATSSKPERQKAVSRKQKAQQDFGLRFPHLRIRTSDVDSQSLCNGQRSPMNSRPSRAIPSRATLRERIAAKVVTRSLRLLILRTRPTPILRLVGIQAPRLLIVSVTVFSCMEGLPFSLGASTRTSRGIISRVSLRWLVNGRSPNFHIEFCPTLIGSSSYLTLGSCS